jgi:hypothetical protein
MFSFFFFFYYFSKHLAVMTWELETYLELVSCNLGNQIYSCPSHIRTLKNIYIYIYIYIQTGKITSQQYFYFYFYFLNEKHVLHPLLKQSTLSITETDKGYKTTLHP